MSELSALRLNLLRLVYLVLAVGLGTFIVPKVFDHTDLFAEQNGVRTSLLSGFAVMSLLGLRYPLQMLPIVLLEMVWKTIYLATFYLPLLLRNRLNSNISADAGACLLAIVFIPLIPWDYVVKQYFHKAGEKWWRSAIRRP